MKTVVCLLAETEGTFKDDHPGWEIDGRVKHDGIVWLNCHYFRIRVVCFWIHSNPAVTKASGWHDPGAAGVSREAHVKEKLDGRV